MWEIREDFMQENTIVSRDEGEIRVEKAEGVMVGRSARVHKDSMVERSVCLRKRRADASGWSPGKMQEVVPYEA